MLERLQKWKAKKGNDGANKCQPPIRQPKCRTVHIKKPLAATNSANKTPGITKKSQGSQSTTKRRQPVRPDSSPTGRRQPPSPEISMREKLELWKRQKEATKPMTKVPKRPWRGGGTPLNSKCTENQQLSNNADINIMKPQVRENVFENQDPTQKELRDTEIPSTLKPEVPLSQSRTSTDQSCFVSDGSSNDNMVTDQDHISSVDVDVEPISNVAVEDEDEIDADANDFILHSSLDPMEVSPQTKPLTPQTSTESNTTTCPVQKQSSPVHVRSCKREGGKSTLKQPNKLARTDKARDTRSVKFTTPVRCSPRLAKIGEGANVSDATPRNKKDMRERLQQWLLEKGKTPSRYSNLLNFQKNTPADRLRKEKLKARMPTPARPLPSTGEESGRESAGSISQATDEVVEKLNATLSECLTLLFEGCPVDHVSNWLDDICRRLPMVEQCAKYWLCRATAAEIDGDHEEVIGVFEEAAEAGAQPVEEIKEGLKALVMRMGNKEKVIADPPPTPSPASSPPVTQSTYASPLSQPTPSSPDVIPMKINQELAQFSGLKYCLTDTTPRFKRYDATPYYTPGLMITPVRRSVRLESRRSFLPANLQDHDICVNSLEDLPPDAPTEFILRSNRALEEEFADTDNAV